ncbi:MAG TPA: hypothetical protein VNS80_00385 [Pseudolysinimonas sp.]|nr:hypothetical protein [Pseudolysinimonas sp.]
MRSFRGLGLLAGTTAIAFATLVIASPAAAATLPDGQKITIVETIDGNDPPSGQFFDVNPADAASTPVGTAPDEYITGLEVNDDGIGAAIGQLDSTSTIWTADANTGMLSDPHPITTAGDVDLDDCGGIDLVNGTFIISCVEGGNIASHVGAVNPADGVFTSFLKLEGDDFVEFDALANDEKTAQLWGFSGDTDFSYTIDLEHDIVTPVAEMDDEVFAADFDRDGVLWVSSQVFRGELFVPALAIANPATGVFSSVGPYVSTTTDAALIFVLALTIWGEPALAATGASGADFVPIGIGSVLLLLAGAAFIATARVNRRSA